LFHFNLVIKWLNHFQLPFSLGHLKAGLFCLVFKIIANSLVGQVPDSQCLLKENSKFLQNFSFKNSTFKENCRLTILFNICHYNSGLALKSKKPKQLHCFTKFRKRKFPKFTSRTQVCSSN
jgi:hypothetical protein